MNPTKNTRALAHEILAYWLRFNHHDQNSWVAADDSEDLKIVKKKIAGTEVNVCNTSMCAAGTAVFLSSSLKEFKKFVDESSDESWEDAAGRLLGLDEQEQNAVFYSDNKSAKRFMRAIASGKQSKFDEAMDKRVSF